MTGEPDNVEGECNARLFIGDNHGDNHATMRCQLLPGHNGWHREMYKGGGGHVAVTWTSAVCVASAGQHKTTIAIGAATNIWTSSLLETKPPRRANETRLRGAGIPMSDS